MKTKMKFFTYILFSLFLGLAISSCEGPDGPQGDQGEVGLDGVDGADGADGTDGTDGTDGENGEDGEDANIEVFLFSSPPAWSTGLVTYDIPEITLDVFQNQAVFSYVTYLEDLDGDGIASDEVVYPAPGLQTGENIYVKAFMEIGKYHMRGLIWSAEIDDYITYTGDNNPTTVRVMIITQSEPEGTAYSGLTPTADLVTEKLEKAGVDITSYKEVAAYYNIKE